MKSSSMFRQVVLFIAQSQGGFGFALPTWMTRPCKLLCQELEHLSIRMSTPRSLKRPYAGKAALNSTLLEYTMISSIPRTLPYLNRPLFEQGLRLCLFVWKWFWKIIFQTFLFLFVIRKVGQQKILSGQWKTLFSQRKIWLGFQESVFFLFWDENIFQKLWKI